MRVLNTTNKPRKWINVEHFRRRLKLLARKFQEPFCLHLLHNTCRVKCKIHIVNIVNNLTQYIVYFNTYL